MIEKLELGPVPYEEDCQQVGMPDYDPERARLECRTFVAQLRRMFGPEPGNARLCITSSPHDFGSYLDVVVRFETDDEQESAYAYKLEGGSPARWDDEALTALAPRPDPTCALCEFGELHEH